MPDLRVLVVEDDPVAAEAHRTYVERLNGFTCVGIAGTAGRALQVLARGNVDVVLLDMHIGNERGDALLQELRQLQIPVAVVTGSADLDSVKGIADAVLGKPFTIDELEATVARLAGRDR